MIRVAGVVSLLHLAQVAAQLSLIQGELLDMACLREEVEGQQGQCVARGGLCQAKHVKLPILLCTLQLAHLQSGKA